ncbi:E3 ubiquitin-protein ligase TRIM39-like [Trachinotus anak]|uniref:E3 ubiquitin-protein ligase TRIM39-like n=1 Tax=Trachinotus anak TaxID=443729 RepID=UPI0039F23FF8
MAAASCVLSEDQFLCPICLDVFTKPVTIPCGHNFCKTCITKQWEYNAQCQCPMCKKIFNTRPELQVNTFISEMAAQLKQPAQEKTSSSSELQHVRSKDVSCDLCTGTKLKALKSCLVCLASYCETHMESHLTVTGLKSHHLIDPAENLENRMCTKHDKPLELFCKADQTCVCMLCAVLDHKAHEVVSLKEGYQEKKEELRKREAQIEQMIQKRQLKILEIRDSFQLSNEVRSREKAAGVRVFTILKQCVDRGLSDFTDTTEEKQRTTEEQAKGLIKEVEQEIYDLMKRRNELGQLSQSDDHLLLLQSIPSLSATLPTKEWTTVSNQPLSSEATALRAVDQFEKILCTEIQKAKMTLIQRYAVDVTLDPDTAHCRLVLSDDGKQVNHSNVKKNVRDNPERFSYWFNVLGKQSFSSGRFYCEVQVNGKNEWYFGMAKQSATRKGQISLSPERGYWTLWLRDRKYYARANPSVCLSLNSKPQKVGIFVDYEGGLVSFYDVESADHIYSFTDCSFTEKLYPFFNPGGNDGGKNSTPLIITPVNHNE